jgi:hypothetical protein
VTGDDKDPFAPLPVPDDLRLAWRERNLPDELLQRAARLRSLNVPRGFLTWGGDNLENVRKRLDWDERLKFGDLRGREATQHDNDAFSELMANSPEDIGEWEITTERGPNAFAQFRLQENVNVLVLELRGVLIACCSFTHRNTIVAGQRFTVRYGQALRVHKDFRRKGYGDLVRMLGWGVGAGRPSHPQYDIMRVQNFAVVGWWQKYVPDFWEDVPKKEGEVPGNRVTVLQIPPRRYSGPKRGIRKIRPGDVPACVRLINRTHKGLDFFRPYSADFLERRLDDGYWGAPPPHWPKVYDWSNSYVLEEDGRIVACAGLWDRGRDARDVWRHKETGEVKIITSTSVLDYGFARGHDESIARLLTFLAGETESLGRTFMGVPLQYQPRVARHLASLKPVPETRALRWGLPQPQVTRPYIDLAYW